MKARDITVIIPAYNAEKYLAEAVKSIRTQTLGPDARIIVIDDGSTDHTRQVANALNLTLICQEHQYASSARNAGIKAAKTEWIYFLDADDVAEENALEIFASVIEKDSNAAAVFSMTREFLSPELSEEENPNLNVRTQAYAGSFGGAVFVKKNVFSQIGMLDEALNAGEGIDWILKFRSSGLPGIHVQDVTVRRRLHASNTGRMRKEDEMKNYAAILRKVRGKNFPEKYWSFDSDHERKKQFF